MNQELKNEARKESVELKSPGRPVWRAITIEMADKLIDKATLAERKRIFGLNTSKNVCFNNEGELVSLESVIKAERKRCAEIARSKYDIGQAISGGIHQSDQNTTWSGACEAITTAIEKDL